MSDLLSKPLSQPLFWTSFLCLPDGDCRGTKVPHCDCGQKENDICPINEGNPASHPLTCDARIVSYVNQIPLRSSSVHNVCKLLAMTVEECSLKTSNSCLPSDCELCLTGFWFSQKCLSRVSEALNINRTSEGSWEKESGLII